MPTRRHVHSRTISAQVYARDDGLWDVEAELIDTKGKDFKLVTGVRPAGEPVHHMRLTITIDTKLNVVDAQAQSVRVPYPGYCEAAEPDYRQLIGLNLMKGFRHAVRERLGGNQACTHMTELTNILPTAAIQAFAGEVRSISGEHEKPWALDKCHALRTDGPAVAQFYPRWAIPAASSQDVPSEAKTTVES